jgi:hypothetical protein
MITIRGLLLFGFLALLSGCVTNACSIRMRFLKNGFLSASTILKLPTQTQATPPVKAQYALNYSKKPDTNFPLSSFAI